MKIKKRRIYKTPAKYIYVSKSGTIIKMRSSWETKYAFYLDSICEPFYYEMMGYKTGAGIYWPDFYLPKKEEIIEIKGRLFPKAKAKIEQFRILYPDLNLIVLFKEDLKKLGVL